MSIANLANLIEAHRVNGVGGGAEQKDQRGRALGPVPPPVATSAADTAYI